MAIPAIFLDRDGVIIENRPNYVRDWSEVEILKPALEALVWLSGQPYSIVIITNQSAVGRNLISLSQAMAINERLIQEINRAGGRIDGVYICPHSPEHNCTCRKPKPGLIQQAVREMNLDLSSSIMVGDALTDIQAGQNAGIEQTALVLTGRGREQLSLSSTVALSPFQAYDNLLAASEAFLGRKVI